MLVYDVLLVVITVVEVPSLAVPLGAGSLLEVAADSTDPEGDIAVPWRGWPLFAETSYN